MILSKFSESVDSNRAYAAAFIVVSTLPFMLLIFLIHQLALDFTRSTVLIDRSILLFPFFICACLGLKVAIRDSLATFWKRHSTKNCPYTAYIRTGMWISFIPAFLLIAHVIYTSVTKKCTLQLIRESAWCQHHALQYSTDLRFSFLNSIQFTLDHPEVE